MPSTTTGRCASCSTSSTAGTRGWEDWFHATGREPIRVIYEEFVGSRAATVGRVLDGLGVDPREPENEKGPMKRQADDLSQDWVARFRHEDEDRLLTA